MPVYKSIQYSVWCDLCSDLLDYADYRSPVKEVQELGWKLVNSFPEERNVITKNYAFCPEHSKQEINNFLKE